MSERKRDQMTNAVTNLNKYAINFIDGKFTRTNIRGFKKLIHAFVERAEMFRERESELVEKHVLEINELFRRLKKVKEIQKDKLFIDAREEFMALRTKVLGTNLSGGGGKGSLDKKRKQAERKFEDFASIKLISAMKENPAIGVSTLGRREAFSSVPSNIRSQNERLAAARAPSDDQPDPNVPDDLRDNDYTPDLNYDLQAAFVDLAL